MTITEKYKPNPAQKKAAPLINDPEITFVMLYGGSNSGKTLQSCRAIIIRCITYPGSTHLIARLVFADAKKKLYLETIEPLIKPLIHAGYVKVNHQEGLIQFTNGSKIYTGGLRQHELDRVLGPKYATIFINECSEVSYKAFEILSTRLYDASKNKAGDKIKELMIVDQNPTVSQHWSNQVFKLGIHPLTKKPIKDFKRYANIHYKPTDNIENIGEKYIQQLENMSEDMKRRFLLGEFGSYQGLVYKFDEEIHVIDDMEIPDNWKKLRSIDFGFVHPFVCLWIAVDPANECLIVYREHYQTGLTVRQHSEELLRHNEEIYLTVCDHDAEDRQTLMENGILNIRANKDVLSGIDRVTDFLHRGKIKVTRSCNNLINEFYSYRWKDEAKKDREVVKQSDDCMDALRYGLMEIFPAQTIRGGIL